MHDGLKSFPAPQHICVSMRFFDPPPTWTLKWYNSHSSVKSTGSSIFINFWYYFRIFLKHSTQSRRRLMAPGFCWNGLTFCGLLLPEILKPVFLLLVLPHTLPITLIYLDIFFPQQNVSWEYRSGSYRTFLQLKNTLWLPSKSILEI